jgi:MFS family permease
MIASERSGKMLRQIPKGVWALGLVSMLMDISSKMIQALLPLYLVTVLGTSMVTVGVIEGIAEATASITKSFSGALSDWIGKRKLLAAIGYGLAAFTKPVFPLASTIGWLVAARFVDRVGEGIRPTRQCRAISTRGRAADCLPRSTTHFSWHRVRRLAERQIRQPG